MTEQVINSDDEITMSILQRYKEVDRMQDDRNISTKHIYIVKLVVCLLKKNMKKCIKISLVTEV